MPRIRYIFSPAERPCTSWLSRCATTHQYLGCNISWQRSATVKSRFRFIAAPYETSLRNTHIIDSCGVYFSDISFPDITCANNVHLACIYRLRNKTGYLFARTLENVGWKLSRLDVLIFLYIHFMFIYLFIYFLKYNVLSILYFLVEYRVESWIVSLNCTFNNRIQFL